MWQVSLVRTAIVGWAGDCPPPAGERPARELPAGVGRTAPGPVRGLRSRKPRLDHELRVTAVRTLGRPRLPAAGGQSLRSTSRSESRSSTSLATATEASG